MESSNHFLELKNETAQIILSLQDEKLLAKVRALLGEPATSQRDLDGIDRGIADRKAGRVISSDEFLKEIADL